MKGAPNSTVKISFFEGALEKPKDFTLTRRAVAKPYIQSYVVAQPKVGYIRIMHLLPGVEQEIDAKLKSFQEQNVGKMILDVRACTEESQETAVKVADLFMGNAPIVQISGRDGTVQKITGDDKISYRGTVVVLADYTTSAGAEIIAGALQDSGVAKVYGLRTYGRGGIQKLIPAGDNYVMLTTQKYLTPKGKVILNNGIEPSITFHDDIKAVQGEENKDQDRMLDKAMEYIKHPEEKAA
jgi:carboxyl-terminal processing protease